MRLAPKLPAKFKTAAQVARFKRSQRDFDQGLLDLQISSPETVQERNLLVSRSHAVRVIDFDQARAAPGV